MKAPVKSSYLGTKTVLPLIELAFGAYFTGAVWYAWEKEIWTSLPFLVLFQVGFLYVGFSSVFQGGVGSGASPAALPISPPATAPQRAA